MDGRDRLGGEMDGWQCRWMGWIDGMDWVYWLDCEARMEGWHRIDGMDWVERWLDG